MRVESKVTAPFKDLPIVDYLAQRFTYLPYEEWQALVEAGKVWCNDRLALPIHSDRQGDRVACEMPDVAGRGGPRP